MLTPIRQGGYKQGYTLSNPKLTTVLDVIVRYGSYYSQIESFLVFLEERTKPRQPGMPEFSSTVSMLSQMIMRQLDILEAEAKELNLKRTHDRLDRIRGHLKSNTKINEHTSHEIRVLREALEDDLTELRIFIPSIEQAKYHYRPKLFGEKVYDAFPSARNDIMEAGNCYSTDNSTACVFHLMRVTEHALRELARKVRVKLKRPIDFEDWKNIAGAINDKLKKLRNSKRGPQRQAEIDFYADAADRCQYFKELWRDNIMHSRTNYDQLQALSVLNRLQEFMQKLADNLPKQRGS
jgi:hypothetical protein